MLLSDRQAIELFHLLFMRALVVGPEKVHVVLKGGCNLRFFFGSPRYSEDIDLDIAVVARGTLKKNVEKILAGSLLERHLRAHAMTLDAVSAPKQTDTTQRWKVALRLDRRAVPLHTKIEFSRRETEDGAKLEAVDTRLAESYRLPPVLIRHYLLPGALRQKLRALAGRPVTQARDVFDLALLMRQANGDLAGFADLGSVPVSAGQRALEVTYDEFVAQVLSFLEPDERDVYGSPEAWEALQLQVAQTIERLRE